MNKTELIDAIAERADISKAAARAALDATIAVVTDELAKGGDVALLGFGTFSIKERAEREGRNPATGKQQIFAASKSPSFKAGKAFKDAVNK